MELETKDGASHREIKNAFGEFLNAFEAFKDANDARLSQIEKRGGDVVAEDKVDRINRALDAQQTKIDELVLASQRPALGGESKSQQTPREKKAFDRYMRKGDASALESKAALSEGTNSEGGYVVPLEIAGTIDRILAKASPIRSIATVQQISSSVYRKPITTVEAASGWVGETDSISQTGAPTISAIDFPAMELYAMPAATQPLLDDAQVDMEAWLANEVQIVFAEQEGAAFAGLAAYVSAESKMILYSGGAWVDFVSILSMQNLPMVGVNATADSTNKLSVQSNAVLFADVGTGAGGTGDIRATLSKQASGNTASFLFQDAFSGRAEIGLTGDDNFHFKVSPDGATWHDAMDIAGSSGNVSIAGAATLSPANANVALSPTGTGKVTINPATAGTLDNMTIGATTPKSASFTMVLSGPSAFASLAVGATAAGTQIASAASSGSLSVLRGGANSSPPLLTLGKTRGAAIGAFATVQSSDQLGRIDFAGDDGTSCGTVAAEIRATVNGSVATGNVPTNLGLYVMSGGALTEMLHIPCSGDMTLATAGGVQAHIADTASAADYVALTGSAAGSPGVVSVGAGGSDTNIDIALSPKGTGAVRLNTVANGSVATALSSVGPTGAHTTVQEWFAVKNAAGVIRYIPAF